MIIGPLGYFEFTRLLGGRLVTDQFSPGVQYAFQSTLKRPMRRLGQSRASSTPIACVVILHLKTARMIRSTVMHVGTRDKPATHLT